jgi:hypothetical protein
MSMAGDCLARHRSRCSADPRSARQEGRAGVRLVSSVTKPRRRRSQLPVAGEVQRRHCVRLRRSLRRAVGARPRACELPNPALEARERVDAGRASAPRREPMQTHAADTSRFADGTRRSTTVVALRASAFSARSAARGSLVLLWSSAIRTAGGKRRTPARQWFSARGSNDRAGLFPAAIPHIFARRRSVACRGGALKRSTTYDRALAGLGRDQAAAVPCGAVRAPKASCDAVAGRLDKRTAQIITNYGRCGIPITCVTTGVVGGSVCRMTCRSCVLELRRADCLAASGNQSSQNRHKTNPASHRSSQQQFAGNVKVSPEGWH